MKPKKRKPLAVILVLIMSVLLVSAFYMFYFSGASTRRLPNRYSGKIEKYTSSVDKDGDGIDDQTDILQGALAYVKQKPQYLSKYYAAGYPDDGYGVCTDVVGAALLAAGYDLMELVQEDIRYYPSSYNISAPDAKIDFRRVNNLQVYFSHQAITLTTDIYEIEQWQGGDIVVFENHIGIVSDRRNANGIPYLVHHSGPLQKRYEEDFLESRDDIIGHYRVS